MVLRVAFCTQDLPDNATGVCCVCANGMVICSERDTVVCHRAACSTRNVGRCWKDSYV
jgi:hypothetical protein